MARVERRRHVRTGRALAAAAVAVTLLVPVARADAAAPSNLPVLQGALTFVDASGNGMLFPSATCEAFTHEQVLSVRGLGPRPTTRSAPLERAEEFTSFDQDLCRLSFRVRPSGGSTSYVLSIGGKRLGKWTRDDLVARDGWLFFTVRGGSKVSSWRVEELDQVHEHVPVPENTEPMKGVLFDPIAWQQTWTTIPGTEDERCALVGDGTSVRAGSIIAGSFASSRARWNGTIQASKLWYEPLHPDGRPPLSVMAQHLDPSGMPVGDEVTVLREYGAAWSATGHFFYATSTLVPERGSWRMTVTAGVNRGCFDFVL